MCKDAESFRIHFHTLLTYSSISLPKHITLSIKQNSEERTSLALIYFFPGCMPPQALPAEEELSPLCDFSVIPRSFPGSSVEGGTGRSDPPSALVVGRAGTLSRAEQTRWSSGRGGGDMLAAQPPDLTLTGAAHDHLGPNAALVQIQ